MKNPFVSIGYRGPDYFCDREEESAAIMTAIENGNNLHLYSIRRIGKSALLHHVFQQLDEDKYAPVFIDIERSESLEDLIRLIIDALVKLIDRYDKSLFRTLTQWVSGFGITLGIDEATGLPKLDISHATIPEQRSMYDVFEIVKLIKERQVVIALDEFQQILRYPEKNTEAVLRSIMQDYAQIRFIYSGSSNHMMNRIFNEPSRPFYHSTQHVFLGYLDRDTYCDFVQSFLPDFPREHILHLMDWCRGHTYYMQAVFNKVHTYMAQDRVPPISELKTEVLRAFEFNFYSVRRLVTKEQWKVLRTIAINEPVRKPTSQHILSATQMAPSSLKFHIDQLLDKELLLVEQDGLKVYDVFLSKMLQIST